MTSPIGKKIESVKQAPKRNSRGSQKMFFHETEDEYEQSKMVPYDGFGNTGIKERNLSISNGTISRSIPSQLMSQEKNINGNQEMSESGEQQDFSDDWSSQGSEIPDVLELDYQLIRLETIIQNSFEQFVNLECVLQPNILNDMGRLRYILMRYVEETIKKSVDDDGQFDVYIFHCLMNNFGTIENFLYLEYPSLSIEYDQQQEVARYELMSDEQFRDEYYDLLQPQKINQLVELAHIQQVLQQDYEYALSRNHLHRNVREETQGPLDFLVSSKQNLFQQLGNFSSNQNKNSKKQDQYKVSIRKQQQTSTTTQNKKSTSLKHQQPKQTKPQFQLFNLQSINNDPPPTNSQSQVNSNKNLTYQQFVSMLEKQKQQQLQKQNKSKEKQRQKQKEKQKKESQQKKKKSHFDQILGRKDSQQSKNYLKPFIGEFKKNESENQLRQLLGLNDGNTPKKQQTQMVEQSTPEFKPNLTTNPMQRNNSQSNPNIFGKALQNNPKNLQNVSVKSSQNKQTTNNTQSIANKNQPNFITNSNLPSTVPPQNRFATQKPITHSHASQNVQSMSPASVSSHNIQTNDKSKNFQNIQQVSQKPAVFPNPPMQGNMNSFQNPVFRNNGLSQPIQGNAGHNIQPVLSNIQQSTPFNNQITRQNNLMPNFKSNTNQNLALNKFENLNSRNQPLIPSSNPQIPSSQMFSNIQMNQNTNNRSNSNPYLRDQNRFANINNLNSMPAIGSNSIVAGHQPQLSQGLILPPIQNNLSQKTFYNLPNQNNNLPNLSSQNVNQNFTQQSNIVQNLPTPSLNGFLGSQKVINPGLINLPTVNPQSISSQNVQSPSLLTQKMSPQKNQKNSRSNSKQIKNLTKNQEQKSSHKLETTQRTLKDDIYDPQVLDNMKLKDFVNIFCQQELKKDYSDLYSELLLLKKWKIFNFSIDSPLYQKFRYLSNFKTKGYITSGIQNKNDRKRTKQEDRKVGRTSFEEPFPLMMILHKKIEQINEQSLFDMYRRQKCSEIPSSFKKKKTTSFEYALNEFNKIEQVQNLLQQKISLLETELEISSTNIKQQVDLDTYLNMNDQLSDLISLAQNVEKWMVNNGLCQENIDKNPKGLQIQNPINEKKSVDFNLLYQLYANMSQIDQDLDLMTENVQKLKE